MKNVILKTKEYKNYGLYNHVFLIDVNYKFNEKSVDEIFEFIKSDPFSPVMIHTDGFSLELISLLEKIYSELTVFEEDEVKLYKEIWLKTNKFIFEDFAALDDKTIELFNIDKIDYIIDALGDEIDLKRSMVYNELIKYEHIECPF
jgi:hypothetical protein